MKKPSLCSGNCYNFLYNGRPALGRLPRSQPFSPCISGHFTPTSCPHTLKVPGREVSSLPSLVVFVLALIESQDPAWEGGGRRGFPGLDTGFNPKSLLALEHSG